jgi:hypothetical protein
MIDLKLNPEALLTMQKGDLCTLDGHEFYLSVVHDFDNGRETGVFLTTTNSRVDEYNDLIYRDYQDHGYPTPKYPQYHEYITHVRHPQFSATMSRHELIGVIVTETYRIE